MAQNPDLSLDFFASGYCVAHAAVANPKTGRGKTSFYAVWALLHLPNVGYVMVDTGYSPEFIRATKPFPARLYRWMTPMFLQNEETAKAILAQKGLAPEDIRYILISHFHGDHIAGLKDFPQATFICSTAALAEVQALSGFKAVKKGILHGLLPDDFAERLQPLEALADGSTITEEGLEVWSLFQQTAFQVVKLPGHARGMLGFIFAHEGQKIFFGTDASWAYDSYHTGILPRSIVKLFFDSWTDFVETQAKIRRFEDAHPDFKILFTHCPETLKHVCHAL